MTLTDTRPADQTLADPITFAMAALKSPSQLTRFDAVALLSLAGYSHDNLSFIPLYTDWYAHPTGEALAVDIEAWFIDTANQLYGPVCPVPHRWFSLSNFLCGTAFGVVMLLVAAFVAAAVMR